MTVTTTTSLVEYSNTSVIAGATLPFPARVIAPEDVKVRLGGPLGSFADYGTDYSVTVAGDGSSATVGVLSGLATKAAALSDGAIVQLVRLTPVTQDLDLAANTRLPETAIETALDRITLAMQDTLRAFDEKGSEATDVTDAIVALQTGKANVSAVNELAATIGNKANASDLAALTTTVSGKAAAADVTALDARLDILEGGPSTSTTLAVTPQQYGVAAGSGTDQRTAFQSFLDALAVNDLKGYVPAGTYKLNSGVTLGSGVVLELNPEAVLDFSGCANGTTFITAAGTISSTVAIGANATAGTNTLQVTSANQTTMGGLAKGDMLRISSNAVFDASNTSTPLGEIKFVQSVSGTTVTLTEALEDTYLTTQTPVVAKITPVSRTVIRGGRIVGNTAVDQDNCTGILFNRALRCGIEGVDLGGMDNAAIQFNDSAFCYAEKCYLHDMRPTATGYGISFKDATRDSWAAHNVFSKCRHSLSTNNSTSPGGIPRRIKFHHNTVDASEIALSNSAGGDAIDTHGAAEFIDISDNTVLSSTGCGINVECPSATIRGNRIKYAASHGIQVKNESDRAGTYIIAGNEVLSSAGKGVYIAQGIRGTVAEVVGVVVANNRVAFSTGGPNYHIASTIAGRLVRDVVFSGNDSVNGSDVGVSFTSVRAFSITGNTVRSPGTMGYSIDNCVGGTIAGNQTSGTAGFVAIFLTGGTNCAMTGNQTEAGTYGVFLDDTQTFTGVWGNVLRGWTTAASRAGAGSGNVLANNVA